MRALRSCLALAVALVLMTAVAPWMRVVSAAVAVVQTIAGAANDVTLTFPGNTSVGNHVLVAATLSNEADSALIDNIGTGEVTLHGPTDHSTSNIRLYIWCYDADGDDDFTVTTSGTATARTAAAEISGGSCTEDGTSDDNEAALMAHAASVTTTMAGSFLFGIVQAGSAADFSQAGATTSVPTDQSEINTVTQGGYVICGAAGACSIDWSSAANEGTLIGAAAVQAVTITSRTGTLLFNGMGR